MLLFRHPHFNAGKLLILALSLVLSTLLSACGYSSLYGQRTDGRFTVDQHLKLIHIHSINERIGQHLHNNLLARLNIKGKPATPLDELTVTLKEANSNLGVKNSAIVTRGNLKISATFTLSQAANKASGIEASTLITATVTTISSYDIPQAHYSALAALKDARARAVKDTADNIRTQLGVYFHQNPQ